MIPHQKPVPIMARNARNPSDPDSAACWRKLLWAKRSFLSSSPMRAA